MRLPADTEIHTAERVSAGIVEAFARVDLTPATTERPVAVALLGPIFPSYGSIRAVAEGIAQALAPLSGQPWSLILSADVAGLVGNMLTRELKVPHDVIVVDGIEVGDFNFVDLGQMLQAVEAIPVVVKSLVFEG